MSFYLCCFRVTSIPIDSKRTREGTDEQGGEVENVVLLTQPQSKVCTDLEIDFLCFNRQKWAEAGQTNAKVI